MSVLILGADGWTGDPIAIHSGFAATRAAVLVGKRPSTFDRRFPFSHQKKFQTLLLLSKTTLPFLLRCIESSIFKCSRWPGKHTIQVLTPEAPRNTLRS